MTSFKTSCERREIARRRAEEEEAEAFSLCERRRSRQTLDVRAADLQGEMAGQRFSVR